MPIPFVCAAGEALVDLVVTPSGEVDAVLGGSVFNTARALGRLGVPVAYRGSLSTDRFGDRLHAGLVSDGVMVDDVDRVAAPTTLALAEIGVDGAAAYRFYVADTSVPLWEATTTSAAPIVFTGGLGLVLEPMATGVTELVYAAAGRSAAVMIDINARPALIDDLGSYRQRVLELCAHAWVVKVSDDDLEVLFPGRDALAAANDIVDAGSGAVVLTRGSGGVTIVSHEGLATVAVPPVEVVDTIGAGDTFDAGFLAWWFEQPAHAVTAARPPSHADLVAACSFGVAAAAVTVGRRGANPPHRSDLDL